MKIQTFNYMVLAVAFLMIVSCNSTEMPPYKNASLPIEKRVSDLVSRMTLEEKAAQLDMLSANDILINANNFNMEKMIHFIDSMCIGSIHDFYPETAALSNEIQRRAVENSRLGIPVLFIEEGLHGFCGAGSTNFPVPIGTETVQLYVRDKIASVATPIKALKGFSKVFLKAGETKTVSMLIRPDEHLWLINTEMKRVVEPGDFELMIGTSSSDIKLTHTLNLL